MSGGVGGGAGERAGFLHRTRGTGGSGRGLAEHLRGEPAVGAAAPSSTAAVSPVVAGAPSGPALVRTRGGGGRRTLHEHLHPPVVARAVVRPVVPAAAPAPGPAPEPAPVRAVDPVRGAPAPPAPVSSGLSLDDPPPASASVPAPVARSAAASASGSAPGSAAGSAVPARVGEARTSERRVLLDEDDPVVTLGPDELPRSGRLSILLEWDRPRTAGGVWSSTDVHLGCLWQTTTGHSGVVQSTGSLMSAPGFGARQVMRLGARTEDGGEELVVDLTTLDTMRRFVLFAHGRRSAPPWGPLAVRLTVSLPSGAKVVLWLGDAPRPTGPDGAPTGPPVPALSVAVASVHLVDGDVILRREADFLTGPARDVALAHGWDLDWSADGTVPRT